MRSPDVFCLHLLLLLLLLFVLSLLLVNLLVLLVLTLRTNHFLSIVTGKQRQELPLHLDSALYRTTTATLR